MSELVRCTAIMRIHQGMSQLAYRTFGSGSRGTTTTAATTTTTTATTNGLPIPVALLAVVAGVRRGLAVGVAVAVDVAVVGLDVQRHRGAAPWQSKDHILGKGLGERGKHIRRAVKSQSDVVQ